MLEPYGVWNRSSGIFGALQWFHQIAIASAFSIFPFVIGALETIYLLLTPTFINHEEHEVYQEPFMDHLNFKLRDLRGDFKSIFLKIEQNSYQLPAIQLPWGLLKYNK